MSDPVEAAHHPRAAKLRNLEKLKEDGINPYPPTYDRSHAAAELQSLYADLAPDTVTEDRVSVAGRVMASRNSGMFMDLHDASGKIQVFSHKDFLDDDSKALLKLVDLGDIIGAAGVVRRTKRGELSVNVETLTVLTKSIEPMPEKFHGLTDVESRYRRRYVDLTINPDTRDRFRKRAQVVAATRNVLNENGFLEVETPMLSVVASGASAKPFTTHHNALDLGLFLRIAPELYLKRLIVGGLADGVYEIGRCFRNEGISTRHNPEFTMAEFYWAYKDYDDMITLTEAIIVAATRAANDGGTVVTMQGQEIDLTPPWPRRPMVELVRDATGVDFMEIPDPATARDAARSLGVEIPDRANWGQVVEILFEEKVEEGLVQPIHVIDMPKDISPLAKVHRDQPLLTERFESYVYTWEVANGFSELNDPADQRDRFEQQARNKAAGDEEAMQMDVDYVEALEFGLPPTGGVGVGIDRLTMLLTDAPSIRDVILFPTLRPQR